MWEIKCPTSGEYTHQTAFREYKVQGVKVKNLALKLATCEEQGFNFGAVKASRNLSSWFEEEESLHCVASWNQHEKVRSKHIQGGTGVIAFQNLHSTQNIQ